MPDTAEIVRKLTDAGANVGAQVRRLITRLTSEHDLAMRVFGGDDGALTPAAKEWLRRLARENYVESSTFSGDRDQMLVREGQRKLAMKILGSVHLDTERLASLTRLEREAE